MQNAHIHSLKPQFTLTLCILSSWEDREILAKMHELADVLQKVSFFWPSEHVELSGAL